MKDWTGKRYWIVGASEGLGRAVAQIMSRAGAEVILSARHSERLEALADSLQGRSGVVTVDVTDRRDVARAAEEVGEIDGLVHTAGVYWPMKATEWDARKAETMADVNFTGTVRLLGAVVPRMVAAGHGHIVLTGSLAAFKGLPGSIGYGASKAAVRSLAESMRGDLEGTGVEVQLVNPGFIRTRMTDKNAFHMPQIMEPEAAARQVFDHMNTDRFARNFPAGLTMGIRGSGLLPLSWYHRLTRN